TIITISSTALQEADRLDAAYKTSGPVGTLHGIPVVLKDQVDAKGMPTTLGSVLFKNYYPDKDAFVVEKLKNAGAIILGKTTLGPMARTVRDLAILLDAMVGYDPEDPLTARGVGHIPESFTRFLDKNGLKGARIGILRESMGYNSETDSDDFKQVTEVFDNAI